MIDVRCSVKKGLRRGSAKKGWKETTKQIVYLTWHKWGNQRKHLTEAELIAEFEIEWDIVEKNNLEKHGCLRPWKNLGHKYELQIPVND